MPQLEQSFIDFQFFTVVSYDNCLRVNAFEFCNEMLEFSGCARITVGVFNHKNHKLQYYRVLLFACGRHDTSGYSGPTSSISEDSNKESKIFGCSFYPGPNKIVFYFEASGFMDMCR